MADGELTPGEVSRTLNRLDAEIGKTNDRLTQVASQMVPHALWAAEHKTLEGALADFKADVRERFKRVEATAVERRDTLAAKDKELAERVDGLDVRHTAKAANWIALGLVVVSVIGLVVTVLTQGGH